MRARNWLIGIAHICQKLSLWYKPEIIKHAMVEFPILQMKPFLHGRKMSILRLVEPEIESHSFSLYIS